MEYTVIEASDRIDLIRDVNEMISEGWEPLGGVAMGVDVSQRYEGAQLSSATWYLQAMIRHPHGIQPA